MNEFIEKLKTKDKVTIVGHSMGGLFGAKYAFDHKDVVQELFLADVPPLGMKGDSLIPSRMKQYAHFGEVLSTVGLIRVISLFKP